MLDDYFSLKLSFYEINNSNKKFISYKKNVSINNRNSILYIGRKIKLRCNVEI